MPCEEKRSKIKWDVRFLQMQVAYLDNEQPRKLYDILTP